MAVAAVVWRFLGSRRVRLVVRAFALILIFFGPIVVEAWHLRVARPAEPFAAEAAAEYRSRRSSDVDRLLPEGGGGTHFYQELPGRLGEAFLDAAAIRLSGDVRNAPWPESVELHERAHLLHAFLSEPVARLMARLPAPAPDTEAADDAEQHFAEMAGRAWEIVAPADRICPAGTPVERLVETDRLVPGTAGFVAWYLRHLTRPAEDAQALAAVASQLIAPDRAEWDAIWQALETRRRPDGSFQPWPPRTVRESIDRRRIEARRSGRWIDRVLDVGLVPSLLVLRVAGY